MKSVAKLNEELDARLGEVRARIQAVSLQDQMAAIHGVGVEQLVILNFNIERLISATDAAALRAALPKIHRPK